MIRSKTKNTICSTAGVILSGVWLFVLRRTDAFFSPYVLVFTLAAVGYILPSVKQTAYSRHERIILSVFALVLSLAVTLASYALYLFPPESLSRPLRILFRLKGVIILTLGGFAAFCGALRFLSSLSFKPSDARMSPGALFLISAGVFAAVYLSVLFLAKYPGILTEDSISQIEQGLSGIYSNHHPVFHTWIIRFFILSGQKLLGSVTAGVMLYSVFQVLVIACCFGYVISTLRIMKAPRAFVIIAAVLYAALPFHIMYSFTMWKDILFSAGMAVFLVTLFRILALRRAGFAACTGLFISGLAICLLRSNGFLAFLLSVPVFAIMFGRRRKGICAVLLLCLACSFVLKNTVLSAMGIKGADTVESLSVPVQQIARVISEQPGMLTDDELALLEKVVDVSKVQGCYTQFISNPVKDLIRETGDQQYLVQHKLEYLKLYVRLGVKYPLQYIAAFADETKGYYNSGYDFWVIADEITPNSSGIERHTLCPAFESVFNSFTAFFDTCPFLQLFRSIGLWVWAAATVLYVSIKKKNAAGAFLSVPLLAMILTLLAATPVFAEFRYAYAVFCCLPFLVSAAYYVKSEDTPNG